MKYPITASRLRKAMYDAGINAATLVQKSGIDKSSISHYVNGTHKPSNIKAEPIAEVLNVSPLWLMGFDVPEERGWDMAPPLEYSIRCDYLEKKIMSPRYFQRLLILLARCGVNIFYP